MLSSNDRTILDDELASFIVGFMIDHHFEIFKVPTLLQVNISAAICQPNEPTVCILLDILCSVWIFLKFRFISWTCFMLCCNNMCNLSWSRLLVVLYNNISWKTISDIVIPITIFYAIIWNTIRWNVIKIKFHHNCISNLNIFNNIPSEYVWERRFYVLSNFYMSCLTSMSCLTFFYMSCLTFICLV